MKEDLVVYFVYEKEISFEFVKSATILYVNPIIYIVPKILLGNIHIKVSVTTENIVRKYKSYKQKRILFLNFIQYHLLHLH